MKQHYACRVLNIKWMACRFGLEIDRTFVRIRLTFGGFMKWRKCVRFI